MQKAKVKYIDKIKSSTVIISQDVDLEGLENDDESHMLYHDNGLDMDRRGNESARQTQHAIISGANKITGVTPMNHGRNLYEEGMHIQAAILVQKERKS